jgi:translation initiation factor IF-2
VTATPSPKDRTEAVTTPDGLGATLPAPGAVPAAPVAERGEEAVFRPALARAPLAAAPYGGRGTPSRVAAREGTAGPVGWAGPAPTSLAAVVARGDQGPSRGAAPEETAGPGTLLPGSAQTSAPRAAPTAPGAERETADPTPASPAAPAALPEPPRQPGRSSSAREPNPPGTRSARGSASPVPGSPRTAPAAADPPSSGGRGIPKTAGSPSGAGPASASPPDPGGSESGRGRRGRQGAVAAPPITGPEGAARRQTAAAPSGSTPLRGEDFRRAWKAAESARNAAGRRGRARRADPAASLGSGRIRLAPRPPAAFDDAPPPDLRLRTPEPPDEAAL